MSITQITLSDLDRGLSYVLLPNAAIKAAELEFTATVREVTEDLAGADGALDTTRWLGTGAVTLTLAAVTAPAAVLDQIGAFLVPWSRPYLVVSDDEWSSPRQVLLRFDSHSHPHTLPGYRDVQVGWKAPHGLWEDTTQPVYEIGADVPDLTGFAFTAAAGAAVTDVLGYRFPASTAAGDTLVTVPGNVRPRWTARLYGPATGPKLTRDDTGQSLNFADSLTIAPGDYVELDSRAMSAFYLSEAGDSRLGDLDFASSQWFPLDPGSNRVRYHASAGTAAGSVCQLTVYPAWMP